MQLALLVPFYDIVQDTARKYIRTDRCKMFGQFLTLYYEKALNEGFNIIVG